MAFSGEAPGGGRPDPVPVVRARGSGRVLALTFDDGPDESTGALLDVLAEHGAVATFCVVGCQLRAAEGRALVRRIVADGHALANHGLTYDDLGGRSRLEVARALLATHRLLQEATAPAGAPVRWFRPANGSWGHCAEVAVGLGMQPLGVVNTIGDWLTQDPDTLAARLRTAVAPGALLVAHDGGGPRWGTVEAVRRVLPELLDAGWRPTLPAGRP